MSDYLFDKSGEPDREVERLEALLSPLAYRGAPPRLPRRRPRLFYVSTALVAAAVAMVAFLLLRPTRPRPLDHPPVVATRPSWRAVVEGGSATWDGGSFTGEARLPVGAWLETGASRVRLEVASIGTIELAPATRARIVETTATRQRLELAHGTLTARIAAPPRQLVVETRFLHVIDVGCAFSLTVDESGRGRLIVTDGRVALAGADGVETVVPAGSQSDFDARGASMPAPSAPSAPTKAEPARSEHATKAAKSTASHGKHSSTAKKLSKPSTKALSHAPSTHAQPATTKKSGPKQKAGVSIHHDALQDLEQSAQ